VRPGLGWGPPPGLDRSAFSSVRDTASAINPPIGGNLCLSAYRRSTMAEANSEHLTSVAPSISRAKS
jgi:hypothetical protein